MSTEQFCAGIQPELEPALEFLRQHPHLIPNEIIFKGLRCLLFHEGNQAHMLVPSAWDDYLAKHPEENFLLQAAIQGYAVATRFLYIPDKQVSASIREGRRTEADRKQRGWIERVARAACNLDSKETTALIREHQDLAAVIFGLEKERVKLESEISKLGQEASVILEKARSEAQAISKDAQTRSENLIREAGERSERMLKDGLAHLESVHRDKSRDIEKLKLQLAELGEEIEGKQALAFELSQDPDIVEEWKARRIQKPKPGTTTLERAREIMDRHLIMPEEASKCLKFEFTPEQLQELSIVSWSEEDLKECRDTHILVPGFPLLIVEMIDRAPANTFYYKKSDYGRQKYATEERVSCRWYLIRKNIVPDSTSKIFEQQLNLLPVQDEVPRSCEMAYALAVYCLVRGQKLFPDKYARCSDLSSHGGRVDVSFCDGRLSIAYWDVGAGVAFGLASSRLPAVGREVPRKVTGIWSS